VEPDFLPGNPGELHDILQGDRRRVSRFTSSAISRLSGKESGIYEKSAGAPQNKLSKIKRLRGNSRGAEPGIFTAEPGK
jgi:hypothetical protein